MHTERRVHRRTQVQRTIEIKPLAGAGRSSKWLQAAGPTALTNAPAPSTSEALDTAPGRMIDIGCGGMCGLVEQTLEIGVPCAVRIHGTEGKVQETTGEIRSSRPSDEGHLVGISFDEPLVALGDTARRGPKVVSDGAVKPLVLVVDDEPSIRSVLERFLTERGLRVFPAENADEALQAIKHERPALMILDLKLPNVGGLELLDLLRRIGITVPNVWAMSGYVSDQEALQAMQLGASEFFNKPFDLDHIDYTLGLLGPML